MIGAFKRIFCVVFIGLIALSLGAGEIGIVKGVLKPSNMDVSNGNLYVVDGEQIKIFSLDSLQLIKAFGREGEGPEEYKIVYGFPLRITVANNQILVESIDKLLFFSLNGEYKREIKKKNNFSRVALLGDRFVARKIVQNRQISELSYSAVFILDQQFNEIKELSRQSFVQQGTGQDTRVNMDMDFLYFHVWENKIFIEESQNGFVISVWDNRGELHRKIKHDLPKIRITSDRKKQLIEDFKNDPYTVTQTKQLGGWNELKKKLKFIYPEYFPGIRSFTISNGKLYVKTYAMRGNQEEFVIMDPKGKILEQKFVVQFKKPWVMAKLLGIQLSTIKDGKIYYLQETDDEDWTLLSFEI